MDVHFTDRQRDGQHMQFNRKITR